MSLPPSDFAAAFRAHVMPKLRDMLPAQGLFVALRLNTFSEVHAELMGEALRLGASNLPREHLDALIEWSQCALLDAAAKAEARVDAHTAAMAHVHQDIEKLEARFGRAA